MNIWVGIYRPEWMRGGVDGPGLLLDPHIGKKCCLGFACLRLGYSNSRIANLGLPASLDEDIPGLTARKNYGMAFRQNILANNNICLSMATANDSDRLSDRVREKRLEQLALAAGYRFVFTNYRWLAALVTTFDKLRHHIWDHYCYGS